MRRQFTHALAAAVAAGGAILLTAGLAMPAVASTRTASTPAARTATVSTSHMAGYVTGGGRHFRYVETTVRVSAARTAAQHAEVTLGGSGATPVFLGVKAGGGANSVGWAIGVQPFGMGGGALTRLAPAPGDLVRLSIYYDQKGHVFFTAVDTAKGVTQTFRATVGSSTLFMAAEAAVYETGYTATVASDFKLWAFTGTRVTTYSGVKGTLRGPWTTSQVVAVAGGSVVMSPSVLFSNGADFNIWRR